jgi:hypothetical protein
MRKKQDESCALACGQIVAVHDYGGNGTLKLDSDMASLLE